MSEVETVPADSPPEAPAEEPAPEAEPDVQFEEPAPQPEAPAEEQPPEPQQVFDPESKEARELARKLKQSVTTWRNAVERLLPDQWPYLVQCELCDPMIPGYHFPAEMVQPADAIQAALLEVLKNPAAPEYEESRVVRQCGDCGGWGKTRSGSRVAGKELVTCTTCKGLGFQGPAQSFEQPQAQNGEVEIAFPDDTQPLTPDDTDAWGSPRLLDDGQENPNWGRAPSYKNPTLP